MADLVRSGAKYPTAPTPITEAADHRHAETDAAILAQWGQEFDLNQMTPDEQREFVVLMADFRETYGKPREQMPAPPPSVQLDQRRKRRGQQ